MKRTAKTMSPADEAILEAQLKCRQAIHETGVAVIRKGFEGIDNLAEAGASMLKRAIEQTLTGKK